MSSLGHGRWCLLARFSEGVDEGLSLRAGETSICRVTHADVTNVYAADGITAAADISTAMILVNANLTCTATLVTRSLAALQLLLAQYMLHKCTHECA